MKSVQERAAERKEWLRQVIDAAHFYSDAQEFKETFAVISDLLTALKAEKERADAAWENTGIIERAYQAERKKRDDLLAENERLAKNLDLQKWAYDQAGKERDKAKAEVEAKDAEIAELRRGLEMIANMGLDSFQCKLLARATLKGESRD